MVPVLEKVKKETEDPSTTPDERPRMVKVTMNLTERDEENAHFVASKTKARTKAQAVSTALSLTRFFIEKLASDPKMTLILKAGDGTELRVIMTELETARNAS